MIAWFFSRLAAFLRDPVGGPAVLGVLVVAGTAWSMGWVVAALTLLSAAAYVRGWLAFMQGEGGA